MKVVILCSCGQKVRVPTDQLHRAPRCPICKRPVPLGFWLGLRAGLQSLFGGTQQPKRPSPTPPPPQRGLPAIPVTPEVERLLQDLGERAWRKEQRYPTGGFLLQPTALVHGSSTEGMEKNLKTLYEHARQWAPGLTIPYKVPRVRTSQAIPHAGQYQVDSDGWVAIDVSTDFASRSEALSVVLAHEACHHILDLSGADRKYDRVQNERVTDLAMFVLGFGDIVKAGRVSAIRTHNGYVRAHLGYLEAPDYDFAYTWVLEARRANGLPTASEAGAPGLRHKPKLNLPDPIERLRTEFRRRIPNAATRQRWVEFYRKKYPQESEDQIIGRILDAQEHDNR